MESDSINKPSIVYLLNEQMQKLNEINLIHNTPSNHKELINQISAIATQIILDNADNYTLFELAELTDARKIVQITSISNIEQTEVQNSINAIVSIVFSKKIESPDNENLDAIIDFCQKTASSVNSDFNEKSILSFYQLTLLMGAKETLTSIINHLPQSAESIELLRLLFTIKISGVSNFKNRLEDVNDILSTFGRDSQNTSIGYSEFPIELAIAYLSSISASTKKGEAYINLKQNLLANNETEKLEKLKELELISMDQLNPTINDGLDPNDKSTEVTEEAQTKMIVLTNSQKKFFMNVVIQMEVVYPTPINEELKISRNPELNYYLEAFRDAGLFTLEHLSALQRTVLFISYLIEEQNRKEVKSRSIALFDQPIASVIEILKIDYTQLFIRSIQSDYSNTILFFNANSSEELSKQIIGKLTNLYSIMLIPENIELNSDQFTLNLIRPTDPILDIFNLLITLNTIWRKESNLYTLFQVIMSKVSDENYSTAIFSGIDQVLSKLIEKMPYLTYGLLGVWDPRSEEGLDNHNNFIESILHLNDDHNALNQILVLDEKLVTETNDFMAHLYAHQLHLNLLNPMVVAGTTLNNEEMKHLQTIQKVFLFNLTGIDYILESINNQNPGDPTFYEDLYAASKAILPEDLEWIDSIKNKPALFKFILSNIDDNAAYKLSQDKHGLMRLHPLLNIAPWDEDTYNAALHFSTNLSRVDWGIFIAPFWDENEKNIVIPIFTHLWHIIGNKYWFQFVKSTLDLNNYISAFAELIKTNPKFKKSVKKNLNKLTHYTKLLINFLLANQRIFDISDAEPFMQSILVNITTAKTTEDPSEWIFNLPYRIYAENKLHALNPTQITLTPEQFETSEGVMPIEFSLGQIKEYRDSLEITIPNGLDKSAWIDMCAEVVALINSNSSLQEMIPSLAPVRLQEQIQEINGVAHIESQIFSIDWIAIKQTLELAEVANWLDIQGKPTEFQGEFYSCIGYIQSLSNEIGSQGISPRAHALICLGAAMQACPVGKQTGLKSYYSNIPAEYKLTSHTTYDVHEAEGKKFFFGLYQRYLEDKIDNENFIKTICGISPNTKLPESLHQILQIKNILTPILGFNHHITFDRHGGTINDALLNKHPSTGISTNNYQTVVRRYLEAITPSDFIRYLIQYYELSQTNRPLFKELTDHINALGSSVGGKSENFFAMEEEELPDGDINYKFILTPYGAIKACEGGAIFSRQITFSESSNKKNLKPAEHSDKNKKSNKKRRLGLNKN
jgi:hypothetical protein